MFKTLIAAALISTASIPSAFAAWSFADQEPAAYEAMYPNRDVLNGGALTPAGRMGLERRSRVRRPQRPCRAEIPLNAGVAKRHTGCCRNLRRTLFAVRRSRSRSWLTRVAVAGRDCGWTWTVHTGRRGGRTSAHSWSPRNVQMHSGTARASSRAERRLSCRRMSRSSVRPRRRRRIWTTRHS
jgi:hypothetical protein